MDDLLREFLTETGESLDVIDLELVRFEQDPNNAKILANIFRLVHTIKGTCGFLNLPRLEALAHAAETLMGRFRDGVTVTTASVSLVLCAIDGIKEIVGTIERTGSEPAGDDADLIASLIAAAEVDAPASGATAIPAAPNAATIPTAPPARPDDPDGLIANEERADARLANQSIRVNVDALERLMTMVSELVLTRNQLLEIARRHEVPEFKVPLQRLSNVTGELQEGVMKARMQPIGNVWQKLPRIVRDLCAELGKEIDIEMHGAETELDRQVLELIKDPLTHMVRNSADHGLEDPKERRAAGKTERGTIRLSAYHEGGYIVISISDDGRGLNTDRIRAKAVALGFATAAEAEKMTEAQIQKFIFTPGFSTANTVTSVSGRGVGMDVVKSHIDQIGGTVDVKSVFGEGSSFTLKIPLTLAIVSALIVESAGERFAIPQLAVIELVQARNNAEHRIEQLKDTPVLRLRNKLLPLIHLAKLLGLDAAANPETGFIVVTQVGNQRFGVVVDSVFHTEEIVIKPMSSRLRSIAMFSGNTILGDGSVIMIVDPNGIAPALGTSVTFDAEKQETEAQEAEETVSLLIFRAGSPAPKAVPLSLVTRLEEVDADAIETSNGRRVVQYRGQLMPILRMDGRPDPASNDKQPLLVFAVGDRMIGLAVDEIVDIVEDNLDIEIATDAPGLLGSAVIRGRATEILDVGHFLPLASPAWSVRGRGPKRSLLLVDDSPFFRNMLGPVLKAAGYEVTCVAGGKEALALIKAGRRIDVVVSDVDMPDMNGFDLAENLRNDPRHAAVPVIGLTALTSPSAIERARAVGFHDFVAKFDRQGLIAALKETAADWVEAA